jgi:hypothetical protein
MFLKIPAPVLSARRVAHLGKGAQILQLIFLRTFKALRLQWLLFAHFFAPMAQQGGVTVSFVNPIHEPFLWVGTFNVHVMTLTAVQPHHFSGEWERRQQTPQWDQ